MQSLQPSVGVVAEEWLYDFNISIHLAQLHIWLPLHGLFLSAPRPYQGTTHRKNPVC